MIDSVQSSRPGIFTNDFIKKAYREILKENRARRKENERKEAEKVKDRFGFLYSQLSVFCKLAKLGSTFQGKRAYGGYSSTFFARLLADVLRIPLGNCDHATARRRLLRAEHLVRIIFQNQLVVKGTEVH